jgi:toxin YoeB
MVMWKIVYTRQAIQDTKLISDAGLKQKAQTLISILEHNPYKSPPKLEKLRGDLTGAYSRRINIKHRLVYQILDEAKTVKIIRMWTHYE